MLDAVLLARMQFAITIAFHFIFPSLTMGLSWFVVYFMTKYIRSGNPMDRSIARFWIKLFTISFAVGVGTGIAMALQFGTNWASYARIVGDIFGTPLVAEAILAFFLESSFLGILIFGWDRVSIRILWLSSLLVAIGTILSAFWILVANSWMQTPAGYTLIFDSSGNIVKAELTDFWAAVFNPSFGYTFLHTYIGSLLVAAFFIFGISAWYHLHNQYPELVKSSFNIAIIIIVLASFSMLIIGHLQSIEVANTQPAKFAVFELIQTTGNTETLPILVILNPFTGAVLLRIHLPFVSLGTFFLVGSNHVFPGMDSFSPDLLPPTVLTMYPLHIMILLGGYFIVFGLVAVFLLRKNKIYRNTRFNKYFLRIAVLSIPLPFIAMELGWMAAEIGRQPWAVYGILKTSDAVSVSVPGLYILISLIVFCIMYLLLFVAWVSLLIHVVQRGLAFTDTSSVGGNEK